MSSFIPSAKHFNSVEISLPIHFTEMNAEKVGALMDDLRRLTATCVTLQYKHHYEDVNQEIVNEITELYNPNAGSKGLSLVGLYKALQCIYYQIELDHLQDVRELTNIEINAFECLKQLIDGMKQYEANKSLYDAEDWEI